MLNENYYKIMKLVLWNLKNLFLETFVSPWQGWLIFLVWIVCDVTSILKVQTFINFTQKLSVCITRQTEWLQSIFKALITLSLMKKNASQQMLMKMGFGLNCCIMTWEGFCSEGVERFFIIPSTVCFKLLCNYYDSLKCRRKILNDFIMIKKNLY